MNSEREGIFVFENLFSLGNGASEEDKLFSHKLISKIVNIYYELENNSFFKKFVILTTDNVEIPSTLTTLIPTLFNPLPSTKDISDFLQTNSSLSSPKIDISSLVNAASGLTIEEIRLGLAIAVRQIKILNINDLSKQLLAYKINRFRELNLNFAS